MKLAVREISAAALLALGAGANANAASAAPVVALAAKAAPARIDLPQALFATGDDPARSRVDFDDRSWKALSTLAHYEEQGFAGYDGWSWYRIHVTIPSSLRASAHWRQRLRVYLSSIDDVDETFFNGVKIGQTGTFPTDAEGYDTKYQDLREYFVELSAGIVHWDTDNVIAIRVYDGSGNGGFYRDMPFVSMVEKVDGIAVDGGESRYDYRGSQLTAHVRIANGLPVSLAGTLRYEIYDAASDRELERRSVPFDLPASGGKSVDVSAPQRQGMQLRFHFTDRESSLSRDATLELPYLLTPRVAPEPRINGARLIGAHPGSPFLHRIAATGYAPLHFSAAGLPQGLALDAATGIITGVAPAAGDYALRLTVGNASGEAHATLTLRVGDTLALTPPMGWNSWNVFGLTVTDERVREAGRIMAERLAPHGWTYINIDDGWEAPQRAADGTIRSNEKFPDLRALGTYLHGLGLKFGIYSSPGAYTCGRFLGSLDHERQDADSYASWGIDYLKYDLCSYLDRMSSAQTLAEHQAPYLLMNAALRAQPRDIVYSLCQYGRRDVWTWGAEVGGNSWRTGGDIEDSWASTLGIINRQDISAPYARSGHWNDPDMLVVGRVGWGGALHPSHLTPDEQYSHISLWSLLAAPLLLGNDLSQLDAFTLNLLTNDEVIAVDQDPLGHAARRVLDRDGWQVWVRELSGGRHAIGVFNFGDHFRKLRLDAAELGLHDGASLRDLWRQQPAGTLHSGMEVGLPTHGVLLLSVSG